MQLRRLVTLLVLCSLVSCGAQGPKIDVCIIDNVTRLVYVRPDKTQYFLPIEKAISYVALSTEDAQTLFTYVEQQCKK